MVLKRWTPLNIVIGGAAGALPPVIGWAAATNSLAAGPIAMFLITFLWTPPHFWALALCRSGDYERVGVPMLPNVVGHAATCRQIVIYSALLFRPRSARSSFRASVSSTARSPPPPTQCSCGARGPLPAARRRRIGAAQGGDGPVRVLDPVPVRPVRGDAGGSDAAGAGLAVPSVNPNQRRRNLIVLVLLAALAAFLYVSVVLKISNHGF
jgi:hypothetical protein